VLLNRVIVQVMMTRPEDLEEDPADSESGPPGRATAATGTVP